MTKPYQERRLARQLRKWGWNVENENGIRRRLYDLAACRNPWWDWGHRLMILVGSDNGGNWSTPEPPTWYYRLGPSTRMIRTGYPQHPQRTIEVIKTYSEFMALTEGIDRKSHEHYEWKAIGTNQDGELILGRSYWGEGFYGLTLWELPVLRKYLRMQNRLFWFGVRPWLYSQALHAAVYQRKPFACHEAPPKGSGGYDHWLCQLPRKHEGPHRYCNYEWDASGVDTKLTYKSTKVPNLVITTKHSGQGEGDKTGCGSGRAEGRGSTIGSGYGFGNCSGYGFGYGKGTSDGKYEHYFRERNNG